jgi:hypothetical protein
MSTFQFAAPVRNPFTIAPTSFSPIPTFVDINGDGDLDLFAGDKRFGRDLEYFENTGSRTNPAFATSVRNPFGITRVGRYNVPTFVDIDNDGDKDLFTGSDRRVDFFANNGSASVPGFAAPVSNPFGITIGGRRFNAPSFADIDGDGDFDLFLGQDGLRLQFFQNVGSASSPSFSSTDTSSTLNLDTRSDGISTATPALADADGDGDLDLFVGDKSGSGDLSFYENTGTRSSPSFGPRQVNPFGFTRSGGLYLFPTFADLDGDGDQDLLTGSDPASIFFYQNTAPLPVASEPPAPTETPVTPTPRRFPVIPGGGEPVTPSDQAPGATDLQPLDRDADGFRENKQARDGLLVDANRDGIADYLQTEVIAIRLLNDGASASDYGALLPAPGVKISELSFTAPSADGTFPVSTRSGATLNATIPSDISNALTGALSFTVSGVTPGGTTQVLLALPSGILPTTSNAYLRFNYANNRFEDYLDSQGNRLYSFIDTDKNGEVDAINLSLIDGDPAWDRDGKANGTILDPGFPAIGDRTLSGTDRKDSLIGNDLANTIIGKKSNDFLFGGLGPDRLIGGPGKDRYVYLSPDDSLPSQPDTVEIDQEDRFDFSSFDANSLTEGQQAFSFIGQKPFSGVPGELRATRSRLEADLNGDAVADFAINLRGNTLIISNNLVL